MADQPLRLRSDRVRPRGCSACRAVGSSVAGLALFIADADRVAIAGLLDEVLAKTEIMEPISMIDATLSGDGHEPREVSLIASRLSGPEPQVMVALTSRAVRCSSRLHT